MADSKAGSLEHVGMPESKEVLSETNGGLSPGDGDRLPLAKSGIIWVSK